MSCERKYTVQSLSAVSKYSQQALRTVCRVRNVNQQLVTGSKGIEHLRPNSDSNLARLIITPGSCTILDRSRPISALIARDARLIQLHQIHLATWYYFAQ